MQLHPKHAVVVDALEVIEKTYLCFDAIKLNSK